MSSRTRPGRSLSSGNRPHNPSGGMRPRRKSSQSHQQQRRDASNASSQGSAIDFDFMDTEETTSPTASREAHFRRFEEQVERFATKLDGWNKSRQEGSDGQRRAAFGFARDCKKIASDTVKVLQRKHGSELRSSFEAKCYAQLKRSSQPEDEFDSEIFVSGRETNCEDLKSWREELSLWELVEDLLEVQFPNENPKVRREKASKVTLIEDGHRFATEKKYWEEFLLTSDLARERYIVLEWLGSAAEYSGDDVTILEETLQRSTNLAWTQSWLHTREKIKGEKRLRLWDVPIDSALPEIKNSQKNALLVAQLDPDAVSRQDRELEQPDELFEMAVSQTCWAMIRRGVPLREIQQWCQDRNEFWRALSIGAVSIGDADQSSRNVLKNYFWRQMCSAASKQRPYSSHERAIMGFLGGEVDSVDPICSEWTDFLFARYNMILLRQYEEFLHLNYPELIPAEFSNMSVIYDPLKLNPGPKPSAWHTMIELQRNPTSSLDADSPIQVMLLNLIGHNMKHLLVQQGTSLSRISGDNMKQSVPDSDEWEADGMFPAIIHDPLTSKDLHTLRILAHLLLIYQDVGMEFSANDELKSAESVLVAYISYLLAIRKLDLIPLYASRLSTERGQTTVARLLPQITDETEQKLQLASLRRYGMEISMILIKQYEFAMEDSPLRGGLEQQIKKLPLLQPTDDLKYPGHRIIESFTNQKLTIDEEAMIASVEWFLHLEGYWRLTFKAMSDVCKRLLNFGRVAAAIELIGRLSFRDISISKTPTIIGKEVDIMEGEDSGDDEALPPLRRSTRPRFNAMAPQSRRAVTPQRIKVHRQILKHWSRTYHELAQLIGALSALQDWALMERAHIDNPEDPSKQMARQCLDDLNSAMEPLLHDILVNPEDDIDAEGLKTIRLAYLPELILGYHCALHCAGHLLSRENLLECLELANRVADCPSLIECFTATGRMPELVNAFASSSKAILKLNEVLRGSKGVKGKRRGRSGRTLGIWDITD